MNGPQITFFGNLVRDPEVRYTKDNGRQFTVITVAVNTYRGRDKERETNYFNVALWREQWNTVLSQCRKGHRVYISGQYSMVQYSRRDGSNGYSHNVNANDFMTLAQRDEEQQPAQDTATQDAAAQDTATQENANQETDAQKQDEPQTTTPDPSPAPESQTPADPLSKDLPTASQETAHTDTDQDLPQEIQEENPTLQQFEEILESDEDYSQNFA